MILSYHLFVDLDMIKHNALVAYTCNTMHSSIEQFIMTIVIIQSCNHSSTFDGQSTSNITNWTTTMYYSSSCLFNHIQGLIMQINIIYFCQVNFFSFALTIIHHSSNLALDMIIATKNNQTLHVTNEIHCSSQLFTNSYLSLMDPY